MKAWAQLGLVIAAGVFICGCQTLEKPRSVERQVTPHLRNNAYSLLYDLLGDERHVSKLLLIKFESRPVDRLIKDISRTSAAAADQLKAFAKKDKSLMLDDLALPPGERAVRDAIAARKKKELLASSGPEFERKLLLTQIEALNYGAHLALVAADADSNPERSNYLRILGQRMKDLYVQAIELYAVKASQH